VIFLQILTKKRLFFKLQAFSLKIYLFLHSCPKLVVLELLVQSSFYLPRRPERHNIPKSNLRPSCTTDGNHRLDFDNSLYPILQIPEQKGRTCSIQCMFFRLQSLNESLCSYTLVCRVRLGIHKCKDSSMCTRMSVRIMS